MADTKEADCDFILKGLKFRYQKNFKAFVCDQKDVLSILHHNYPNSYEKMVVKYPELQSIPTAEPSPDTKAENGPIKMEVWSEPALKETKDVAAQVKDGKDGPDENPAGNKKPGMISRLSKGIKKIIARLTPTKLRKKWHLDEDEVVSSVGEAKQ